MSGFLRGRFPLAMLAGLVLAAAFPNIGIAGFGWVAPGLMLAVALGTRGGEAFRLGYVAGLAHYLASLYWLLHIPVRGFPILGWIALSGFLALFPAVWVSLAINASGIAPTAVRNRFQFVSENPHWPGWTQRTLWALGCAALWVALEMVVARIFGGFPWNLLGASQYRMIPLIQIASITGVYGVSFLLVWTSVSVLNAVLALLRRPHSRAVWIGEMGLPLVTVAAVFSLGLAHVRNANETSRTLRVTLIQPSIPQTMIWDPAQDDERFQELVRLSNEALTNATDVLVWPEAAVPKLLRYEPDTFSTVTRIASTHRVWMIIGADDAEPALDPGAENDTEYYNSSFLISPEGRLVARYKKRSLVIFGEYIPLERWLPLVKWLTPVTGSFTPGTEAVPFRLGSNETGELDSRPRPAATTSVLICFEDNFPHLVREHVTDETDFLVNITNNGWFGESAAQWQHAANAVFRAIENGLPLVRCSNNGLTGWVDRYGRLRAVFRDEAGTIYGSGFMTADIPLRETGAALDETWYHAHGDAFGWSCVGLSVIVLVGRRLAQRRVG